METRLIIQIPIQSLDKHFVEVLRSKASFVDTDKDINEFMITNSALEDVINETSHIPFINELKRDWSFHASELLAETKHFDYIQITTI